MWFRPPTSLRNRLSVVLFCLHGQSLSHLASSSEASLATVSADVCEFKTINYITHTLPQQCLKTSWPGDSKAYNATPQTSGAAISPQDDFRLGFGADYATPTTEPATEIASGGASLRQPVDVVAEAESSPRPFMSFEEWKEMMLRKAGHDPSELKPRRTHGRAVDRERTTKTLGLDSLGDDGEIDLNFDVVSEKISNIASAPPDTIQETSTSEFHSEPVLYDDGRTQYYRSKDAGKTCKERFSYSSFDAGATVLKTNKGAKNAKAILVENKDSYMLLECSADNKFVIVELSDDILVDTIVLANFEFFSSMIRQFRVSVSDRYPVKADKWKDLGTFEAKNSRDIQPFLVQNPLIWAKYVRVEFLSHYGNEFYCPVSLLRVHGTRMLESLKDTETAADEEDVAEDISGDLTGPASDNGPTAGLDMREDPSLATTRDVKISYSFSSDPTHPRNLFWPGQADVSCPGITMAIATTILRTATLEQNEATHVASNTASDSSGQGSPNSSENKSVPFSSAPSHAAVSVVSTAATSVSGRVHQSTMPIESRPGAVEEMSATPTPTKAVPQGNAQPRPKSNSTTTPASPTVQESFFKAVSKRLQLLEANVTLSLKYIEDQSRSLQETQDLVERRQLYRIDLFLDSLNHTVLSELRNVRQQYDQIWQSTVIALESQREQSQRETVALGSRLNILADEVVFQKRMAIVQSILLLSCLVLVIFSRAMTQPILTGSPDPSQSSTLTYPSLGPHSTPGPGSDLVSRYEKFGQLFGNPDCGEGDRSGTSPGTMHASSVASHRLLKPNSDVIPNPHSPEDASSSRDAVLRMSTRSSTGQHVPEKGLHNEYFSSSLSPAVPLRTDNTSVSADKLLADRNHSAHDSGPLPGAKQRLPALSVSSTARKPLPALPEYPP